MKRNDVLIVSRLDGPTAQTVRRIVDDTLATEQTGLQGTAYFDARWQNPQTNENKSGYALYDAALHNAAANLAQHGRPDQQPQSGMDGEHSG